MWRDCWIVLLSRPARALWIEMTWSGCTCMVIRSRPARALWIEIPYSLYTWWAAHVEAREGLVD